MPSLNSIRFQKFDKYSNPIFIVNSEKEPVNFKRLTKYYTTLESKEYNTFLPIYSNEENKYATIRFKKNSSKYPNFTKNNVYDIKYSIKQKEHEGKTYVNCYINSLKLVSRAPKIDLGQDIDFGESDEE